MRPARVLMPVTVTFWWWSFVATKICLGYLY
jgi:hypothetical protein